MLIWMRTQELFSRSGVVHAEAASPGLCARLPRHRARGELNYRATASSERVKRNCYAASRSEGMESVRKASSRAERVTDSPTNRYCILCWRWRNAVFAEGNTPANRASPESLLRSLPPLLAALSRQAGSAQKTHQGVGCLLCPQLLGLE